MPTIPEMLLDEDVTAEEAAAVLRSLGAGEIEALARAFAEWAHAGQLCPPGRWRTWVLMGGRGFGKTRAGAEWVLECVRGGMSGDDSPPRRGGVGGGGAPLAGVAGPHPDHPPFGGGGEREVHIALVAATVDEARRVMVEGESGILACARGGEIDEWAPARRELRFAGGARATLYSGASPEGLRGPQHHFAWCDELAKWRHAKAAWDMLQLGLRCGERPRALVTTTPRGGCEALAAILADPATVATGGASRANPHLPEAFLAATEAAYGGTRMGREELDGEWLPDVHGALWPAALVERCRGERPADAALARVVIGVDPPAGAGGTCGIVACGLDREGVGWVLADHSAGGLSPEGWARRVAAAAEAHGADRIVAEGNQGGEMVRAVLRSAGIVLPVTLASASRGKGARAEPVAGLFESGRARFGGRFAELEAQLSRMVPAGYAAAGSPDRADAMVWALWALMIAPRGEPRVWGM